MVVDTQLDVESSSWNRRLCLYKYWLSQQKKYMAFQGFSLMFVSWGVFLFFSLCLSPLLEIELFLNHIRVPLRFSINCGMLSMNVCVCVWVSYHILTNFEVTLQLDIVTQSCQVTVLVCSSGRPKNNPGSRMFGKYTRSAILL